MHRGAESWSRTHGSRFDLTKYQLLHLTRNPRRHNMRRSLDLPKATTQLACYLGIILDQVLRWWPHIQHIQGKTTATLSALKSLAGSTWGVGLTELRMLYQSIVIPQITYGCSVWYTPHAEKGYTERMQSELTKIQLQAARIISG